MDNEPKQEKIPEDQNPRLDQKLLAKKDVILKLRDKLIEQGRAGKLPFERNWFRNILFYVGKQWISYNTADRNWVEVSRLNDFTPMPVTNKYAMSVDALKSFITQKQPRIIVRPGMDNDRSIAVAEIGDTLIDIIRDEAEIKVANDITASWLINTGNGFFEMYYYLDPSLGMVEIPIETCVDCMTKSNPLEIKEAGHTCPNCGGVVFKQAVNPKTGKPEALTFPKGKLKKEAVSPFEMFFNTNGISDFSEVRQLVRRKRVPKEEVMDSFQGLKNTDLEGADSTGLSELYASALSVLSPSSMGVTQASNEKCPIVFVDYLRSLPTEDFPEGLMATCIGKEIVELSTWSYVDEEGRKVMCYDHAGGKRIPGGFWRKSPMDDVVPKQVQRNRYESFTELHFLTMSGAKVMVPQGANMDAWTGDPNQIVEYTHRPQYPEPKLVKGIPPPEACYKLMDRLDKDIDDLTGTRDVLRGEMPAGLDTFAGLRLLTERAFSLHSEMIENWEQSDERTMRILLEIARINFIEPRKKTFENTYGSWETKQFSNADLEGGTVDIKVEAGSSLPKSQAVEDAALMDSIRMGLIDIKDPANLYKVLTRLGQTEFAQVITVDRKDAMREWQEFRDSVLAAPENPKMWILRPRLGIDNEVVHYQDAVARCKSDEFTDLPKMAQDTWIQHATMHKMNVEIEMMKQQALENPQPKPPLPGRVPGVRSESGSARPTNKSVTQDAPRRPPTNAAVPA